VTDVNTSAVNFNLLSVAQIFSFENGIYFADYFNQELIYV